MKELFDLDLWKKIQDQFSDFLGKRIIFFDDEGNEIISSGKDDYLRELVNHKNKKLYPEKYLKEKGSLEESKIVKNIDGTYDIIADIKIKERDAGFIVCGGFRTEKDADLSYLAEVSGLEHEEVLDAFQSLEITEKEKLLEKEKLIRLLSKLLPNTSNLSMKNSRKISNLIVVQKISQIAASNSNIDDMMQKIMNFISGYITTKYFGITILKDSKKTSYRFPTKLDIESIDSMVFEEMKKKMMDLSISNLGARGIKTSSFLRSAAALPLFSRKKIIGMISLYSDDIDSLENDKEFLFNLRDQLAVAVSNALQFDEIKTLAVKDKLTGFYNRRYFMESFENELRKESEQPVSLIMIDIDDFGHYNNTNGHQAGDKLLQKMAEIINSSLRKEDICGRYGGEEFIVLLPETKPSNATEIAERIRKKVEETDFDFREKQPLEKVTISLGLITVMDRSLTYEEMIKQADDSLYRAKKEGKNKFVNTVIVNKNMRPVDV